MSETRDVVLAIDVGDSKLAAGLMTMKGDLLDRDDIDIDHALKADSLFASLNTICLRAVSAASSPNPPGWRLRPAHIH